MLKFTNLSIRSGLFPFRLWTSAPKVFWYATDILVKLGMALTTLT